MRIDFPPGAVYPQADLLRPGPRKNRGDWWPMRNEWWLGVWGQRRTGYPFRTGPHIK